MSSSFEPWAVSISVSSLVTLSLKFSLTFYPFHFSLISLPLLTYWCARVQLPNINTCAAAGCRCLYSYCICRVLEMSPTCPLSRCESSRGSPAAPGSAPLHFLQTLYKGTGRKSGGCHWDICFHKCSPSGECPGDLWSSLHVSKIPTSPPEGSKVFLEPSLDRQKFFCFGIL